MKNYRYFGRYLPDEWENDKEWMGKRLDFLWEVRRYYPQTYTGLGMHNEKEDFYDMNDDTVSRVARSCNSYSDGELDRYKKIKIDDLVEKYKNLVSMKKENRSEFMKKCNCNLYAYCVEHMLEEIQEYMYYDY